MGSSLFLLFKQHGLGIVAQIVTVHSTNGHTINTPVLISMLVSVPGKINIVGTGKEGEYILCTMF